MHVATSAWGLFAVLVLAMLAIDLAFDARARRMSRAQPAPRSRASPSASTVLVRRGPRRHTPATSLVPMRARPSRRG